MPIYRRGAVYWWRRNLSCPSGQTNPITIRISLKTASAHQAKGRAAALELEWDAVATTIEETLRSNPTREDLARVYHLAFKTELDRIIIKQLATPMRADAHAAVNRIYAQLFTLIARSPRPPVPDAALMDELIDAGLDPAEAEKLHLTLQMHSRRGSIDDDIADGFVDPQPDNTNDCDMTATVGAGRLAGRMRLARQASPISPARVGAYLQDAGVRPNSHNKDAAMRVVAAAYRNACLEASSLLGKPAAPGTIWPLPGNLLDLLGLEQNHDVRQEVVARAPDNVGSSDKVNAPTAKAATTCPAEELADLPITELATAAITVRVKAKEWDPERARDVDAAVKLFVAANGNILFSTIRQHHLAATVALFPSLPTRYGFARKDPVTGKASQESIEDALTRGQALRIKWAADPVAAERALLPTVGLGPVTHNKHLTWLSSLVSYAKSVGRPSPKGLDFTILRVKGSQARRSATGGTKKKNEALAAFSVADLRHLFTAPIWTGCAGLWQRFEAGTQIFHDAWYWAPLIIALHACRSDEGTGIALDDIHTDGPVPFFHFRTNAFRRIKTASSDRKVPIHPKLIALGFLDYVRAMRALGHRAAFPELLHPTLSFDHNFYDKIFEPLRACQFPSGTSRMRGRKDVDVRSIRSRCISHLRDVGCPKQLAQAIVGHEVGDVTSDIYEEDPDPALLLPWVEKLGDLVPELPFHALNLRPSEWQKFGAPRGRRSSV